MDFYFLVLSVLFLSSNIFWAIVVNKLINKLMSRDYFNYKVSESVDDKVKKKEIKNTDPSFQEENYGQLHELMP